MELIKEKKTAELNRDILQTKILKSQELNEESLEE